MIRPNGDNPSISDNPQDLRALPAPKIKRTSWTTLLIWLVPLAAAALAGYYGYEHLQQRGPDITISFGDGSGLKEGETPVTHLGVQIGKVSGIELSGDRKQVLVHVTLERSQDAFARDGATFWTVRPQISVENVSGLSTILSGPYIEATPGSGVLQSQFEGLSKPPVDRGPGVNFVLNTPRIEHLSVDGPVYYRGIEVGNITGVGLSSDASGVDVHIFVQKRYTMLVQKDSQFWLVKAADIKGGLFSGVQFKLGSLQSLVAGGVTFATPENGVGVVAPEGFAFPLYDDAKKDWLDWSPRIPIPADDPQNGDKAVNLPQTPDAAKSLVN